MTTNTSIAVLAGIFNLITVISAFLVSQRSVGLPLLPPTVKRGKQRVPVSNAQVLSSACANWMDDVSVSAGHVLLMRRPHYSRWITNVCASPGFKFILRSPVLLISAFPPYCSWVLCAEAHKYKFWLCWSFCWFCTRKKNERERKGGLRHFGWSKPGSLSVQRIVYLSKPWKEIWRATLITLLGINGNHLSEQGLSWSHLNCSSFLRSGLP